MILPKSKIVATRNILPTFLKKIKMLTETESQQTLGTCSTQWAYSGPFHAFTSLRFKSYKADCAGKSGVRYLRNEYHIQCKHTENNCREVTVPSYRTTDTASLFTLQRDELQTSLVNCQHWHISMLHLSQEHRLIICSLVFKLLRK